MFGKVCAVWLVGCGLAIGQAAGGNAATAPPPTFEVSSVKLAPADADTYTNWSKFGGNRFTASYVTLKLLVGIAFGVQPQHIVGAPGWTSAKQKKGV